jgi:general secretion pathway protein E
VEEDRLRELASEAPTVNLLNSLIAKALRRNASDMHIEPHADRARVRFRIDGVLHEIESIPAAMVLPVITRLKILAAMDIAERRRPQDGKIELRIGGEEVDVRVSALPLRDGGESAVLRFLRKGALIYDMSLLGLSPDIEASILEDLAVTSGVVLMTGPTGSGKTTSLYTFLSRINSPEVKIITLEDPVEYHLAGVNQVQVQPDIGFDFARGLRSIVRQDPDVIMVGEIRDSETASVAMQSALTGHLVFSTVHTNDAPSAFTRLLDLGVEEYLLSAALRSIVAQRLVRRLCTCSVAHPDAEQLLQRYRMTELAERSGLSKSNLRQSVGCDECGRTGYRGRLAWQSSSIYAAMKRLRRWTRATASLPKLVPTSRHWAVGLYLKTDYSKRFPETQLSRKCCGWRAECRSDFITPVLTLPAAASTVRWMQRTCRRHGRILASAISWSAKFARLLKRQTGANRSGCGSRALNLPNWK